MRMVKEFSHRDTAYQIWEEVFDEKKQEWLPARMVLTFSHPRNAIMFMDKYRVICGPIPMRQLNVKVLKIY